MHRALYVAAGKRGRQSLVVASNCSNSASRLYCDTFTPQPRQFITTPFRRQVFNIRHGLSHPGANATVKLVS